MRLTRLVLFLGAVFFLCGFTSTQKAAKIFGNMTYLVGSPHAVQKVKLVNGKHEEEFLSVYYQDQYVYGDFNHDGLKDAAVIIMENFGGNADEYELAFLINDGKKLVHRASYYLDLWAIVNSVLVKKDKVIVDMYVHQDGDCNAGPSRRVRNVYKYSGQNIVPRRSPKNS